MHGPAQFLTPVEAPAARYSPATREIWYSLRERLSTNADRFVLSGYLCFLCPGMERMLHAVAEPPHAFRLLDVRLRIPAFANAPLSDVVEEPFYTAPDQEILAVCAAVLLRLEPESEGCRVFCAELMCCLHQKDFAADALSIGRGMGLHDADINDAYQWLCLRLIHPSEEHPPKLSTYQTREEFHKWFITCLRHAMLDQARAKNRSRQRLVSLEDDFFRQLEIQLSSPSGTKVDQQGSRVPLRQPRPDELKYGLDFAPLALRQLPRVHQLDSEALRDAFMLETYRQLKGQPRLRLFIRELLLCGYNASEATRRANERLPTLGQKPIDHNAAQKYFYELHDMLILYLVLYLERDAFLLERYAALRKQKVSSLRTTLPLDVSYWMKPSPTHKKEQ